MLRSVLGGGGPESGESSASEDMVKPMPEQAVQRFDQYELVKTADGNPVELGRGAMGVTCKAFDVDLHCLVTLKVINERYLGDEAARLCFLREARAAASVRHPNVASVFHRGRTGQNYFYAMEFVEGETLEDLIKRSSRIEVKFGARNRGAGRRRFGCGAQAEDRSSGHQTKQHHGELGRGRRCDRKDHRSWAGQACTRRAG